MGFFAEMNCALNGGCVKSLACKWTNFNLKWHLIITPQQCMYTYLFISNYSCLYIAGIIFCCKPESKRFPKWKGNIENKVRRGIIVFYRMCWICVELHFSFDRYTCAWYKT